MRCREPRSPRTPCGKSSPSEACEVVTRDVCLCFAQPRTPCNQVRLTATMARAGAHHEPSRVSEALEAPNRHQSRDPQPNSNSALQRGRGHAHIVIIEKTTANMSTKIVTTAQSKCRQCTNVTEKPFRSLEEPFGVSKKTLHCARLWKDELLPACTHAIMAAASLTASLSLKEVDCDNDKPTFPGFTDLLAQRRRCCTRPS